MYKLYRQYFEYLCSVHPELLHVDAAGKKVFETVTVEEAFGDYKTKVPEKGYAFRLLEMSKSISDNEVGDVAMWGEGGFIILHHWSERTDGGEGRKVAFDKAEAVMDDFIVKMIADSAAAHPLFPYSIAQAKNMKLNANQIWRSGDGSYAGWFVTFSWMQPLENCLGNHTSDAWKAATPKEFNN